METAMIKCPTCGSEFPAGARFCPHCGYVVPETSTLNTPINTPPDVVMVEQSTPPSWGAWIAGTLVLLLLVIGFAMWSMGYIGSDKAAAVDKTEVYTTPPAPAQPDVNVTVPSTPPAAPAQPDINITVPPSPPPIVVPPANPPANPPMPAPPAPEPPKQLAKLEIVSVRAEPELTDPNGWRYGYEFKLRNNSNSDSTVDIQVKFLDGSGFVVDDDVMDDLYVPANSERTFRGTDIVRATTAQTIKTVRAEFR